MPDKFIRGLNTRLTAVEVALQTHLIESGEIRSDLKWLKKGYWVVAGGILTVLVSVLGTLWMLVSRFLHP